MSDPISDEQREMDMLEIQMMGFVDEEPGMREQRHKQIRASMSEREHRLFRALAGRMWFTRERIIRLAIRFLAARYRSAKAGDIRLMKRILEDDMGFYERPKRRMR